MGDLFENGPNWDFSEGGEDGSGRLSRKCSRLVKRYSRGGGVGVLVENAQDWLSDIQSIILTPDSNDFEFW